MTLANLFVRLDDARFAEEALAAERRRLEARGLRVREGAASERDLAWIDAVFGGAWSSEARLGTNVFVDAPDGPAAFVTLDQRALAFYWLKDVRARKDTGIFGPFGVAPELRGAGVGGALARLGLGALRRRGHARAAIAAVQHDGSLPAWYAKHAGAHERERVERKPRRFRTTVLASGGGTNFQTVLDAVAADSLDLSVAALVVNKARAYALERGRLAGVAAQALLWERTSETRASYDARVLEAVTRTEPELILLLGWMHVLPPDFVARFDHILNIHPAFLPFDGNAESVVVPDGRSIPAFRGAHAVADAVAANAAWYGASAHRVGIDVDRGEILARRPLPLAAREPDAALAALRATERSVLLAAVRRWTFER